LNAEQCRLAWATSRQVHSGMDMATTTITSMHPCKPPSLFQKPLPHPILPPNVLEDGMCWRGQVTRVWKVTFGVCGCWPCPCASVWVHAFSQLPLIPSATETHPPWLHLTRLRSFIYGQLQWLFFG
jgi:hypothetical protein